MILADKILELRKQFGWSQEELADKLDVSRQSVSKWEGAHSIPDINKIIKLGEIFGVSTDYLLKDEIETSEAIGKDFEPGVVKITLEEGNKYIENTIRKSKLVSIGILFVLCSLTPLFLLLGLAEGNIIEMTSNTAIAIGLMSLFILISIAVSYFIRGSQYDSKLINIDKKEFELLYGVRSIYKEKLEAYRRIYNLRVSISVTMFLTSVIPLLMVALIGSSTMMIYLMVALLLLLIGLGIYNIIPVSALFNAYNQLVKEGIYAPENIQTRKRIERIAVIYWSIIVAIYIGWSLWTMQWGVTWIIWPVASIAFAAVVGLVAFFDERQR